MHCSVETHIEQRASRQERDVFVSASVHVSHFKMTCYIDFYQMDKQTEIFYSLNILCIWREFFLSPSHMSSAKDL